MLSAFLIIKKTAKKRTRMGGIEPPPKVLETFVLPLNYIRMMEGEGFEPPNPKERIYSPPRLATSLPFRRDTHLDGGYFNLPHFFADWLVWIAIVCVNQAVRAVFSAIDYAHTSRVFIKEYEEVMPKKVHLDGSVLSRHDLNI